MKNTLLLFFTVLLLFGCEDEIKLPFENVSFEGEACQGCPEIAIAIPRVLGETRIAARVNNSINEELIYALKFEDSIAVSTVKEAIQSFTKSYQDFKSNYDDEAIAWEAEARGTMSFETPFLLSIRLDTYTFTGGAHGYEATTFLNFDKEKGVELENNQLFNDLEGFKAFTEQKFRATHKIPEGSSINATGFMFFGNTFHLSENLGFTESGIQLIYNQYEVASYADGPIKLLISFTEANPFLKDNYQVKAD